MIWMDGNHSLFLHVNIPLIDITTLNQVGLRKDIERLKEKWENRDKIINLEEYRNIIRNEIIPQMIIHWNPEKGKSKYNIFLNGRSHKTWLNIENPRKFITSSNFVNAQIMSHFILFPKRLGIRRCLNYMDLPPWPMEWTKKNEEKLERNIITDICNKLDDWETYESRDYMMGLGMRRLDYTNKLKGPGISSWRQFGWCFTCLYISYKLGLIG